METTDATKAASDPKAAAKPKRPIQQVVVRELGEVGKYRVRLVKASSKPDAAALLDVREYVHGANYEGFTRKGIRLGRSEAAGLQKMVDDALKGGALG